MHFNEGNECSQTNGIDCIVIYGSKTLPLGELANLYVYLTFFHPLQKLPLISPSLCYKKKIAPKTLPQCSLSMLFSTLKKQEVGSFKGFNEDHYVYPLVRFNALSGNKTDAKIGNFASNQVIQVNKNIVC